MDAKLTNTLTKSTRHYRKTIQKNQT